VTFAEVAEIAGLTVRVGAVATLVNLVPGVLLALLLARREFPGRSLLQALIALPLILPPVAIGLLLLKLLSRRGPLGLSLAFTWQAAALASAVMAFPLLVRTAEQAFAAVPRRLEQVAHTLGASRAATFFSVTLPLARRGVLSGILLSFARSLGEFGASVVVAGAIPHRTETLSMAIYARVQDGDDPGALALALCSLALGLAATLVAEALVRRGRLPA
jgi:molybdate transport system permease protein